MMNHPEQPPPPPSPLIRKLHIHSVANGAGREISLQIQTYGVDGADCGFSQLLFGPEPDTSPAKISLFASQTPSETHRVLLKLKRPVCFQSHHHTFPPTSIRRCSPGTRPQQDPISINRGTGLRIDSLTSSPATRAGACTPRKLAEHEQQQDSARVYGCRRKSITFVRSFVSSVKVAGNTRKGGEKHQEQV
ncbi:hypothetical protein CPAR01_13631 [Colletotrichum paranaense]|uniref:Uncharacterized protein n=1 Tax=Colletotrichum paranaense TaxID=1914294 RepID=A0ABQ9S4D0_9PEZI|nr:uncharacterized protein CPAR01_13631 [Colletotrichum paranaense]KAK1524683.1 hypothetical protein CPAR01_13631 [Colletotrichum paranaense]